jgi:ATP-binding cassette subfamily C protein
MEYYRRVPILENIKLARRLLSKIEQIRLAIFGLGFLFLSLLELVAMAAIIIFSYTYLVKDSATNQNIGSFSFESPFEPSQLFLIIIAAYLSKNILGILITKRFFEYLSLIETRLTTSLLKREILKSPSVFSHLVEKNFPRTLTEEVSHFISGVVGYLIIGISDLTVLIFLLSIMALLAPALLVGVLFSIFLSAVVVYKFVSPLAVRSGISLTLSRNDAANTIRSLGLAAKTLWVSGNAESILEYFRSRVLSAAQANSKLHYTQQLNKYIVELVLLFSIFPSVLLVNTVSSTNSLITTLAILFATTFRILPALLRVQSAFVVIKASVGNSDNFISLMCEGESLRSHTDSDEKSSHLYMTKNISNEQTIILKGSSIYFSYSDTNRRLIFDDFSFSVPKTGITAILGPSGSGKTTLIDLILGILKPLKGDIEFFSNSKSQVRLSYMPQRVPIFNLSIAENIALGVQDSKIDLELVKNLLSDVGLDHLISFLSNALDIKDSATSSKLSGGELQRLGIARALYESPDLMILDEPTGALDQESEKHVIETLKSVSNRIPILVVSHSKLLFDVCDHKIILG